MNTSTDALLMQKNLKDPMKPKKTKKNEIKFSENWIKKIKSPPKGKRIYFVDKSVPTLRLVVSSTGGKTFQFRAWDKLRGPKGQTVTLYLSQYPTISVDDARKLCKQYAVNVAEGRDIIGERQTGSTERNLDDLFHLFMQIHGYQKKSAKDDRGRYALYIKEPLGKKRLSDISSETLRDWSNNLGKVKKQRGGGWISPSTQNRARALLKTILNFNKAEPDLIRELKNSSEEHRITVLSDSERNRLLEVIGKETERKDVADLILLALLTGQREGNLLNMKWDQLELDESPTWTIPRDEFKGVKTYAVPLVPAAVNILKKRSKGTISDTWVFTAPTTPEKPLNDFRRPWKRILKAAEINDFRFHDLRHSAAAFLIKQAVPMAVVQKTLGHADLATTMKYINLVGDDVRDEMVRAMENIVWTPKNNT